MNHILVIFLSLFTLYLFKKLNLANLIKKSLADVVELKNILLDKNSDLNSITILKKTIVRSLFINIKIILIFVIPILLVLLIYIINPNFINFFLSFVSFIEILITCIVYFTIQLRFNG
tara:strand:+ start:947 stop:1300 length:354 start_codon:yes stop_codon:yes gene_type:complete